MKKLLLMSLPLLLCGLPAFAGGTGDSGSRSGGPVKLDIIRNGGGLPSPDKDAILKTLNEKLNLDITFAGYSSLSDYTTQLNTRMASGSYPDLFWVNKDLLNSLAAKGLLMDLSQHYQNELKPVADHLGRDLRLGISNGKNYGIPHTLQFVYNLDFVRKDWLDNLNLKAPATVEEFFAVAQAFTNNDPDGNGKKDTYGLTGTGIATFSSIFGSLGVGLSGGLPAIYIKNGQLVSSVTDPDARDAILAAKHFIDAGVVDPEILANSTEQVLQDKAFQGRVGIVRIGWSGFMKDEHIAMAKAGNSNAEWIPIHVLNNGNGKALNGVYQIGTAPHMFAVPVSIAKDTIKRNAIFNLLNYVSQGEGYLLAQYGIEGVNFRMNNGKVEPITFSDIGHVWLYQFTGRDEMPYLAARFPNQEGVINFAATEKRIEGLNGFVDYPAGFVASDAATYAEQ
jgi:putative aldouronate transport system substrate-binding protein